MIARFGPSWQTTTADLALILFLVVAAAQASEGKAPKHMPERDVRVVETPATAVYRPGSAISLEDWLAAQGRDERLTATVLVHRSGDPQSAALATGNDLLTRVEGAGWRARMLVEPGRSDDVSVVVAYDKQAGTALAQAER